MKLLKNLTFLIFGVAMLTLFTGCEDDPVTPTPTTNPPVISLVSDPGFISDDALVTGGEIFMVKVTAAKGDNAMTTFTVKEDGSNVDLSRISINGAPAGANPILLFNADKDGFTWEIGVAAPTSGGSAIFSFQVDDEGSQVATTSILITPIFTNLSLQFMEMAPYFWEDATVDLGSVFQVRLVGERGSNSQNLLSSLGIYENDTLITDLSRFSLSTITVDANPLALTTEYPDSFNIGLSIKANDAPGITAYSFVLQDQLGISDTVSLNISTGTPIDETLTGVLLNQAGPQGQGGLDLDTGNGNINSTDMDAEIKDEGIDIGQPIPENWIQRISGANGAEVRMVGDGLPESFSFDNVTSKEEISSGFDLADVFTDMNMSGDLVSPVVNVDDMYIVKNSDDSRYYLIKVTAVNITSADNADNYEISIKY